MQNRNEQQIKGQNKINFKEKNLQYIEKLKQKNKREQQEKLIQQKKIQFRRESLRKKILEEASVKRQNKLRELIDIDNTINGQAKMKLQHSPKRKNNNKNIMIINSASNITGPQEQNLTDLLPKISNTNKTINYPTTEQKRQQSLQQTYNQNTTQQIMSSNCSNNYKTQSEMKSQVDPNTMPMQISNGVTNFDRTMGNTVQRNSSKKDADEKKINYQNKYIEFLQNLHEANRKEKQMEEKKKKKQEQKYSKMKQELGYANVQGKLNAILQRKQPVQLLRSRSAQKCNITTQPLISASTNQQSDMPKTVKNFKQKNDEYIEKIKKRRQLEQQKKQQQIQKKQKLKQNLKQFVINTVKKNVLQGVYDDEIVEKNQKKKKKQNKSKKEIKENDGQGDDEEENCQQSSSSEQEEEQNKKKKRKLRPFPHCTDYSQWKKKNRIQQSDKVFIVTGGYPDLKKALRQKGWYQNPTTSSPFFDLKFTLQGKQIDYANLDDFQLVNHFQKNGVITTKIGLTKSLRNLMWINDTSEDNFYPKCFDLNDQDDKVGFQTHFKLCKAISLLKIYVDSSINRKKDKANAGIIEDLKLRTQVALSVCEKNIQDLNELIDKKKNQKLITDKQWQILSQDQLNQQSLAKKKHQQWLKSIDCKFNGPTSTTETKQKQKKPKKKSKKQNNKQNSQNQKNQQQNPNQQQQQQDELIQQVKQVLSIYQQKFPQYHLTGHNNIWILKPAGLSRGRGITTYNNLVEIQDHMKTKQSQWIAQKYIENPLIIERRKFDIRQWVIATNFNPLTIWFYDQCYVRFSAADYDAKQVGNKFIHLCNNSIGAYSKDFHKSHIKGNMYFMQQMRQYLKNLQGYDVFQQKIKPQMKQIVKHSLMCAIYGIENRKNSHEMFGYDFMVDTNYKVWLLEINSSPSMDYSTHVTTKLVKQVLIDTVKVIVDYANASKKQKKNVDTGKFKKIYKGIQIPDKTVNTAGLNLCLQGVAIKKCKKNNTSIKEMNITKYNKTIKAKIN